MTRSHLIAAAAALTAVMSLPTALPALAQAPATASAAQPAEVKALVDRVRETYRGLSTYRDTLTMSQKIDLAEGAVDTNGLLDALMQGARQEMSFAYGGERRFAVDSSVAVIATDGATATLAAAELGQYRQFALPPGPIASAFADDMVGAIVMQHPVFSLVSADSPFSSTGMLLDAAKSMREEEENGRRLVVLDVSMAVPGSEPMQMEVRIDPETHLLAEMRMDITDGVRSTLEEFAAGQGDVPEIESIMMVLALSDVRVNEPVTDEMFVVNVEGLKKVERFDFGMPGRAAEPAAAFKPGDPAPAFTAPSLAGGVISLADFRGKVVVLDFWATWCAPCVAAIPKVQKISAEYADRGVVVLGINQDRPGHEDRVKSFVERKKITFAHAMDPKAEIGRLFKVQAIPTTVVIDRRGVIRFYEIGFRGEDVLRKAIEEALNAAGEG